MTQQLNYSEAMEGKPCPWCEAGIALARRATIATRNTRHFEGLDVSVISPWDA